MRIVHLAKFYPPEFGGIESVTEALAEDHAALGHDVHVVCFTRGLQRIEKTNGVNVRRIKVKKEMASQPLSFTYIAECVNVARTASVVHVHAPNLLAALGVLRLPKQIKVVVHWHADIENKGILGRLVGPLERAMLRRANVVIATSQAYADASAMLNKVKAKLEIIPIGIADMPIGKSHRFSAPPYVLCVGRLVPYKGFNVMLQAVALMSSNIEFRVVGSGPMRDDLEAQAGRLGIMRRVNFLGRVEQDELQALMAGAVAFCLPSLNRSEAFGVVLLEAMRAGRAIVGTKIPGSGVPWVNSTGINVSVGDPSALAQAIDYLIANPEEVKRLGGLARSRFEDEFTQNRMSNKCLRLYEDLMVSSSA